jgi:hypothetical protein
MKKLDLSAVTTSIGFPVKHGTMDHIQSAYQEALAALAQSAIGNSYDTTKVYILYGCVATGTDPGARTFTAGAVFYNGEVYLVDAATFTSTGGNVAIGTITTTYFTGNGTDADPVTFTDATARYVHQIRKMVISAGTSVGALDFSNWLDYSGAQKHTTTTSGTTFFTGTGTLTGVDFWLSRCAGRSVLNFAIVITIASTGTGNKIQFYTDIPDTSIDIDATAAGLAFSVATGVLYPQQSVINGIFGYNKLLITATIGATGSYAFTGQIVYRS